MVTSSILSACACLTFCFRGGQKGRRGSALTWLQVWPIQVEFVVVDWFIKLELLWADIEPKGIGESGILEPEWTFRDVLTYLQPETPQTPMTRIAGHAAANSPLWVPAVLLGSWQFFLFNPYSHVHHCPDTACDHETAAEEFSRAVSKRGFILYGTALVIVFPSHQNR